MLWIFNFYFTAFYFLQFLCAEIDEIFFNYLFCFFCLYLCNIYFSTLLVVKSITLRNFEQHRFIDSTYRFNQSFVT